MNIAVAVLLCLVQEPDLERLIKELDHEEIERRERATEALRKLEPDNLEIDKRLEAITKDGTTESAKRADLVRRHRIAGRLFPDPVRIVERLNSPDVNVRTAAIAALAQRGGAGAPLVTGLLNDASAQIRASAIQILIAANDAAYLSELRAFAEHPQFMVYVLPWLASRGDLSAAEPLRKMFETGQGNVGWAAPLLAKLEQPEDIARFSAAITDQPMYATTIFRAIRHWKEAKKQLATVIRMHAFEGSTEAILLAADSQDPHLIPRFRELCRTENYAAAFALGAMNDREAIPYLLRLVRHRRLQSAIGMLGRLKSREAVWLFRRMMSDAPLPEVQHRVAYARALADIGGIEAEDLLIFMLEDAAEETRFEAATALGRLKCKRALPFLVKSLDDAIAFQRILPPPVDGPVADQFEGKPAVVEWRQTRDAAIGAFEAITGEAREGSLEEKSAAWRSWWAARK